MSYLAEAADIMKDIVEAIAYLHSQGIAHRDVKVYTLISYISSSGYNVGYGSCTCAYQLNGKFLTGPSCILKENKV
ncbi:hypothetical protein EB796_000140 [Bugula neritina]|uniref:Protein kinase domain-containing protein n=1 Tax=Bugula neritina TaxID=10212 RepID=A0A7J7KTZ3_BUGNE|nr:hypothetical protein EB796_009121 [Bugula neritina]KAF6041555.1 hypothetical protein EB796_000140 [Bugula neritina]